MTLFTPGIWSQVIQSQVSSQDSHLHLIVICISNAFSVTTSVLGMCMNAKGAQSYSLRTTFQFSSSLN